MLFVAIWDAVAPPTCPPIPSQTTYSSPLGVSACPKKSSLAGLTLPTLVLEARFRKSFSIKLEF